MHNSFYAREELLRIGFKAVGKNVLISRFARFYDHDKMEFGDNVRIDDFCILSGNIITGSNIHISAYTAMYGKFGIELEDYSGISPRCTIFSATDDFSGEYMIGPMIDQKFTNVSGGKVLLKKYSQIGSSCVVLPNVVINEGAVTGAMSLIIKDLEPWSIYKGIPAVFHKVRSRKLLELND